MKRWLLAIPVLLAVAVAAPPARAQAGKKVLFVNSYHEGYKWSDGEEKGARAALQGSGVELRFVRLDAKRRQDDASIKKAAEAAKAEIEAFKPDVVIVADDPAVKYLLQPYFKDAKLPFVFCGVNWDAAKYGLPYKNATGILEVSPVKELLAQLLPLAKGTRLGYLGADYETDRTELAHYKSALGVQFAAEVYAKNFVEWKEAFQRLQGQVDAVILGNYSGLLDNGWNEAEARALAASASKIPSGTAYELSMPFAMLGHVKIEEEQGAWAATTALRILKGEAPASIAIARNRQSKILINLNVAKTAGVMFKPEVVRVAQVVQ